MRNALSLNDLYTDFSAGLLNKKQFEGEIFKVIQKRMDQAGLLGLNRDDHDDYISWLYPRISSAIDKYRETGSSFEVYIGNLVRLTVKEYRLRQARDYAADAALLITQLNVCESIPQYECVPSDFVKPDTITSPRQHLILILKNCSYVSDDFLERASPKLGIEPEKLQKMVNTLRKMRLKREIEKNVLRERVNYQFFRCLFYEQCLRSMSDDSVSAKQTALLLERGRKRLTGMRKRLTHMRLDPSNSQIAEVLGVAKGTVDAALYHLKKRHGVLNKL